MKTYTNRHKPETRLVLRTFQMVAFLGLIIGIATLARDTAPTAEWRHLLYTTWFAIAIVSIEAILNWIKIGVYALGLATIAVTAVDILEGAASYGGASLGLLVVFILMAYLHPIRHQFE